MSKKHKILLAVLVLVLASLACGQQIAPAALTTPTIQEDNTLVPHPSPTARATVTQAPASTQAETAQVMAGVVRVRESPGGPPLDPEQYVYAGMPVTVLEYSDDGEWVRIEKPAGWVWRGCVSDNPEHLFCEAVKP